MFNQFQGVRPLVEGLVDADYVNCVPTGTTIVDRTCYIDDGEFPNIQQGFIHDRTKPERTLPETHARTGNLFASDNYYWNGSEHFQKSGVEFQTSLAHKNVLYRIYISNRSGMAVNTQFLYVIATDLTSGEHRGSSTPIIIDWIDSENPLIVRKWSWAVSSTKPNQIYFSFDTKYIYWFNVADVENSFALTADEWEINCMIGMTTTVFGAVTEDNGRSVYMTDETICKCWDAVDKENVIAISGEYNRYSISKIGERNTDIAWYDNKLCVVDKTTGVLNMTCTDPAQFYRQPSTGNYASFEPEDLKWMSYSTNNLWTSWYASTLSSDELIGVVSAFGYLFFINKNSVECWVRSGTEAAPLNPVSSYVINFSVDTIQLVGNYLLAVGKENGKIGVYSLKPNEAARISNSAVEKYLDSVKSIGVIYQNEEGHTGFFKDDMTIVLDPTRNIWYRLNDAETTQPRFFVDKDRAVSPLGSIITPTNRMLDYGEFDEYAGKTSFVERVVVDNLVEFTKRKSLVKLDVLGDMGSVELDAPASVDHVHIDDNLNVSLEVSTTHGKKWSTQFFRKAPPVGKYDAKVTYNGLGSGESFLMKLKWWTQNHYTLIGFDLKVA